jgi:hypothetical protein
MDATYRIVGSNGVRERVCATGLTKAQDRYYPTLATTYPGTRYDASRRSHRLYRHSECQDTS